MNENNETICVECNNFIPYKFGGHIIPSYCSCRANPIHLKSHITGKVFTDYQSCYLINNGNCKQFETKQVKPSWVDAIKAIIPSWRVRQDE